MRNILVPTDFSDDAYNALHYATQLYKKEKCTFYIFHTYNRQSYNKKLYGSKEKGSSLKEFLRNKTDEQLLRTYHRIMLDNEENPLHTFKTISKHGDLLDQIKEFLNVTDVQLLVMGNKGKTGAKEIFIGSNTLQVVKEMIPVPVFCVPKEINYKTPAKIALITDFKHQTEQGVLSFLKDMTQLHNTALHVFHMCNDDFLTEQQKSNKDMLANYYKDDSIHFHREACKNTKAETIKEFVERQAIDLLAMVYYRHYLLDKLFREPVVLDVSFYLDIPFLVMPDQD